MNNENWYNELSNSITRVFDTTGVEILFTKVEIKDYKIRFSSCKKCPTLFLDDKPISRLNRKVEYKCKCGAVHTILLKKFLSKKQLSCVSCRENDEKIAWHKLFFDMKRNGLNRGYHKRKSNIIYNFDLESEEFKTQYFNTHLTIDEFNNIKQHIYSIDNVEVYNNDIELLLHEPVGNQKKYHQVVKFNDTKLLLRNVYLKCKQCGKVFRISRLLKERVRSNNFKCNDCTFSTDIFKVIQYNEYLNYQGKLELSFIEQCNSKNIEIINGPIIKYKFNNREHNYKTDFYLPQYNIVIETKDNHIWHKCQIKSGKWSAKETAAVNFCKQNGMKFILLFPEDFDNFFKSLNI